MRNKYRSTVIWKTNSKPNYPLNDIKQPYHYIVYLNYFHLTISNFFFNTSSINFSSPLKFAIPVSAWKHPLYQCIKFRAIFLFFSSQRTDVFRWAKTARIIGKRVAFVRSVRAHCGGRQCRDGDANAARRGERAAAEGGKKSEAKGIAVTERGRRGRVTGRWTHRRQLPLPGNEPRPLPSPSLPPSRRSPTSATPLSLQFPSYSRAAFAARRACYSGVLAWQVVLIAKQPRAVNIRRPASQQSQPPPWEVPRLARAEGGSPRRGESAPDGDATRDSAKFMFRIELDFFFGFFFFSTIFEDGEWDFFFQLGKNFLSGDWIFFCIEVVRFSDGSWGLIAVMGIFFFF